MDKNGFTTTKRGFTFKKNEFAPSKNQFTVEKWAFLSEIKESPLFAYPKTSTHTINPED